MGDIGDSYGMITAEWFGDELSDFMYTFDDDADGDFISRVNHLSKVYNKTGEDLVSELIAFAANQKRTHMDMPFIDLFEQTILAKKANQLTNDNSILTPNPGARTILGERNSSQIHSANDDMDTSLDDSSYTNPIECEGPILEAKYASFTPIRPSYSNAAYQNRKNSGKIVQSYVGKLFAASGGDERNAEWKADVDFVDPPHGSESLIRFGNEKDAEQIEEICSHIDVLSDAIRLGNEQITTFERCDHISTEPFFVCGQIVDENGERLEEAGCCIRSDDEEATMVHLDLSKLPEFSLFPGKVVALKGTNEDGSTFTPTELFEPAKMQISPVIRQPGIDRLHVWCAAGPFTSADTLSYEQLFDLLELAKKERPHVLVLMGPIVDRTSAAVLSPHVSLTFTELLENLILNVSKMMESTDVQILLIPSGKKDATVIPIFPTAPFEISRNCKKSLSENILFGADPSQISIAGVQFALTNSEIMQVMGREEIHRSPTAENEDRMARIASHLVRQRSLYPLYPPPVKVAQRCAETIRRCALNVIPHVMIVPSLLAPMIKAVDGCICINPGVLARGNGGTFMKMEIDLAMIGSKPGEFLPNCSLTENCQVKVVRI